MPDTRLDPFAGLLCYTRRFLSADDVRFASLTLLELYASVACKEFGTDPVYVTEQTRWKLVKAMGGAVHV